MQWAAPITIQLEERFLLANGNFMEFLTSKPEGKKRNVPPF